MKESKITIWSSDIDEIKSVCQTTLIPNGWMVEKPIEVKWNWWRFESGFVIKLVKNTSK